jgi:hypothetical protein
MNRRRREEQYTKPVQTAGFLETGIGGGDQYDERVIGKQ